MLLRSIILIGTCMMMKDSVVKVRATRTGWNVAVLVVNIMMLITSVILLLEMFA